MILDLFIYIIQFYINQNTFLPGFIIRKELSNIMCIKQKEYNLTKTSLCKFVSKEQKKFKNYINSHQAQAEAEAVYKGVEKVLFEDGRHLHYRRYNSFDCIKQKCAATGVRLLRWDTICFMKHYYKVRVPKNEYIQNILVYCN